jgi:glycosyltransferase involved in cell wall biosynthesis
LAIIRDEVPQLEFHIYGDGSEKSNLEDLVQELVLQEKVIFKNGMPLDKIAAIMAEADLGIVPKRDDSFGGEAFSTKILEFMALGVPVIVSETKIDRFYFNDSIVKFFKSGDENDFARSMLLLIRDKGLGERLSKNALKFVAEYTWDKKEHEYLKLINSLTGN